MENARFLGFEMREKCDVFGGGPGYGNLRHFGGNLRHYCAFRFSQNFANLRIFSRISRALQYKFVPNPSISTENHKNWDMHHLFPICIAASTKKSSI